VAEWQRGGLYRVPCVKWACAGTFGGKQRGVNANAVALGSGMQADVDGGVGGIGGAGALIERDRVVGVAKQQHCEAAEFKFVAQKASPCEREILFGELISERGSAFVAAVRGIDDGEKACAFVGCSGGRCSSGRGFGGLRRSFCHGWKRGKDDGLSAIGEAGDQRNVGGDVEFGKAVRLRIAGLRDR